MMHIWGFLAHLRIFILRYTNVLIIIIIIIIIIINVIVFKYNTVFLSVNSWLFHDILS